MIRDFLKYIGISILLVIIFFSIGGSIQYYVSVRQARVYNEINETDWSAWDFFWAENQINSNTQTLDLR